MQMVRTPYWTLERDVGNAFFRLRRTATPIASLDDLKWHAAVVERVVGGTDVSRLGLLIDLRLGPLRNDPEFEKTVRPYQQRMMTGFARVAILVATPVGKLQTARMIRPISSAPRIFDDEQKAIEFLNARE